MGEDNIEEQDDRKKTSIAKRLIVFVVLGNFVIATLITSYNLLEAWKKNLETIQKGFVQIKKSSGATIGTSLYTEDEDQTNKGLEGIVTMPDIVLAKLYDMDGVEELAEGKKPDPNYIKETTNLKKEEWGQMTSKNIDVMYLDPDAGEDAEPEKVGLLVVSASMKGAVDRMKAQGLTQLAIQVSQVIATTFLIFFIFRNLVSRHLSKMAHYADTLDLDDLSGEGLVLNRKKQNTKDELEEVVLSFNGMKDNLKISHAKLKDYAENLEDKVREATREIEEEKEKVSNLLNNMQQAVFSVCESLEVIGPVSAYTDEVFGYNVIGKNILETLYKDVGRQSEQFSNIKSALFAIFGENELQYLLMEEHLALRMKYIRKIEEDKDDERVFSISYNPLWDEDGNLENLMFIVEDITEREKLQAKVEEEKKVNAKNISIITEMANSDIEDISQFLQSAPKLVEDTMVLAKAAPSDVNVLTEMFRYLHTLKGNSRAFNFFSISSITHIAESHVVEIKKSVIEGNEVSREDFNPVISKLYEINSEINDYGSLAKKVFRIENEFEKKLVGEIQNFTVNLDQLISKNVTRKEHLFNENQPGKTRKKVFVEVQEREIKEDMVSILKRNTHSLKGSLRSMNRLDVSEMVHQFEGAFTNLEDMKNATMEEFSNEFIGNYVEIKDLVRSIYQQSDMNMPYTKNVDDWSEIFKNFYDFSKGIDHIFEMDDSVIKLERILSDCRRLNFHFLSRVFSDIFGIIKSGPKKFLENKEKVRFQVRELWLYFSLVGRLDYTQMRLLDNDNHFLNEMKNLGLDRNAIREKLSTITSSSILVKTLKRIMSSKEDPNELFREAQKYIFEEGDRDIFDYFVCTEDAPEPKIKMILADFRTTRIVNDLPDKTRALVEDEDPIATLLIKFFEENSDYLYLKLIDFSQLLNGFYQEKKVDDDEEEEIRKVETIPVVVRNLKRLNQTVLDGNLDEIKVAAQRLTDIPVIPSLQKFKSMVMDISTKLNKNVDFRISGNEITLNREALNVLQDAFVHLLRNSIDHGIEDQEERRKVGKKPQGIIEVFCNEPDINFVEIKIKDDGAGIDPKIIKEKALAKQIYPKEELDNMNEEEIMDIIFLPSFSQKDQVDELSGRGVGMDIVKKNLEKLGGDVKVRSVVGKGTEFLLVVKSSSVA